MYFGVYFGAQRGFVFCRGRTNSQLQFCKNRVLMNYFEYVLEPRKLHPLKP